MLGLGRHWKIGVILKNHWSHGNLIQAHRKALLVLASEPIVGQRRRGVDPVQSNLQIGKLVVYQCRLEISDI